MSARRFARKASNASATLLGLALALSVSWGLGSAHAAGSLPYSDPNAKGQISLCSKAGKPVLGGGVADKPFVWSAVSSERAPAPYNGATRTATLFAFQPRRDIPAEDWSGLMLTASSRYTNTAHPIAQATMVDWALADFLSVYPASWDGLVQLRIYLGAADQPTLQQGYATADIKVTGDRWQVVRGGDVPCNSGKATSLETTLLPADFFSQPDASHPDAAQPGADGAPGAAAPAATGSSPGQPGSARGGQRPAAGSSGRDGATSGGSEPGGGPASADRRAAAAGSSGGAGARAAAIGGLGILVLVTGGVLWIRFRRRRGETPVP